MRAIVLKEAGNDLAAALAGIRALLEDHSACLMRLGLALGEPSPGEAALCATIARLQQQRRDALEAGPMILRRLTAIERHLCLAEVSAPKPSRRRPLEA